MDETFGADTEGMGEGGVQLQGLLTRLGGVVLWLRDTLPDPQDKLGDPKKDPIAATVNGNYIPEVANALDAGNKMVEVAAGAVDGVFTMSHELADTEQRNVEAIPVNPGDHAPNP